MDMISPTATHVAISGQTAIHARPTMDILDILAGACDDGGGATCSASCAEAKDDEAPLPQVAQCSTPAPRRPSVGETLAAAERRSAQLAQARLHKRIKQLRCQNERLGRDARAAKSAWNSTQLHVGDEAAGTRDTAVHKNQFSLSGMLRLAFDDSLDARCPSKAYVDVRGAVVHCSLQQQSDCIRKALDTDCPWLFIERSWDDTPCHMAFGQLSEAVAPSARFVLPLNEREKIGKGLASFKDCLKFGIPLAQHGVVDVFAQTCVVEAGPGLLFEAVVPARVLLGKTAGHVHRAVQTALDGQFNSVALAKLAKNLILLIDNADSAASNRKAMFFWPNIQNLTSCASLTDVASTNCSGASQSSWSRAGSLIASLP